MPHHKKGTFGFCVSTPCPTSTVGACGPCPSRSMGALVKTGWKHCRGKLKLIGTGGVTIQVCQDGCKGEAVVTIKGPTLFTATGQTLVNPAALTSLIGPISSGSTSLQPNTLTATSSQVVIETTGTVAPGAAENFTITATLNSVALAGTTITVPITVAGVFTYKAIINGSSASAVLVYNGGANTSLAAGPASLSYMGVNTFDVQGSLSGAGTISTYATSITVV